jgi:hypothetical protein
LTAAQAEVLRGGGGSSTYRAVRPPALSDSDIAITEDGRCPVADPTWRSFYYSRSGPPHAIDGATNRRSAENTARVKDYADWEQISINTVKFHLKTAFERTGTRSQLELLRRTILALDDLGKFLEDLGP